MYTNSCKIHSGKLKGRRILFSNENKLLKPSSGFIREVLFNWLEQNTNGMKCLDLFSGSGIHGFEAISWGAEQLISLEYNLISVRDIKKNAKLLNIDSQTKVYNVDSYYWIKRNKQLFDLIFLDAPFTDPVQKINRMLKDLVESCLSQNGKIYYESDIHNKELIIPPKLKIIKEKVKSNVKIYLLTRQDDLSE